MVTSKEGNYIGCPTFRLEKKNNNKIKHPIGFRLLSNQSLGYKNYLITSCYTFSFFFFFNLKMIILSYSTQIIKIKVSTKNKKKTKKQNERNKKDGMTAPHMVGLVNARLSYRTIFIFIFFASVI
jgi:hypothetical protein